MVGRRIEQTFPPKPALDEGTPVVLEVREIQLAAGAPSNRFFLREGEILGFAGLVGSGRSELARAVIGADPAFRKKLLFRGREVALKDTAEALENGLGLLPENRKTEGLIVDFSIRDNISINNLKKYLFGPFIDRRAEGAATDEMMRRVGIKAPGASCIVSQLSGGNQQKVVIARWLNHHCKALIFDEPTRGIDVGAKAEIYALMRYLTGEGYSIIFISSELPEIVGLCDRVAVFRQGAIVAMLDGEAVNSNEVMRHATTGN
jgi:ribose transport system ATP-binding protein